MSPHLKKFGAGGGKRVHPLPSQKEDIMPPTHGQFSWAVGVRTVSPMHAAVAVAKGKGKGGNTVVVRAVDCQLARIRQGSGGQDQRKQKGKEKEKKVFHALN